MSGTWLDGWVGALVAAAVTVCATVAWEGRSRRGALLDEALARLAEAADDLGIAALGQPRERSAPLVRPLLTAITRACALAERPVGLFPSRLVAPARHGLGVALRAVMVQIGATVVDLADESNKEAAPAMAALCAATSSIAWTWWRSPLRFLKRESLDVILTSARAQFQE